MLSDNSRRSAAILSFLLIFILACGVSFDLGNQGVDSDTAVEQTLQALYAQYTAEAGANPQPVEGAPVAAEESAPPPAEIPHSLLPGNPGSPEVDKDEIDTSNTAGQKLALGDSFRLGNFERPFTQDVMDYHPEDDLLNMQISKDDNFFYFVFEIAGPDEENGILSATYGVEFDTDYDGRGDVLLFAKGNGSADWTIDGVAVYADTNNDVGGSSPVVPDTNDGNGYDQVLFSINDLNDPDGAWQKASGSQVYMAVKRSLVGNNRFYWRCWADSGLADPSKFDYNDAFSESQAGSPVKTGNFYPVGQLNLMDSTCWIAYNLDPTGNELGGCYQIQPTTVPLPTATSKPSCPSCSSCFSQTTQACCQRCPDCAWNGSTCYDIPR